MQVLGDIPRLNAKRFPDKKALIMDDDSITFSRLNDAANRLANGLLALGIKPGDKVALMAQNCLEFPIIVYAVAKCAAVLVPVNFRYEKTELVYVIDDSEPKALFYGPEFSVLVNEAITEISGSVHLVAVTGKAPAENTSMTTLKEGQPASEPAIEVNRNSAAMIMYTSGTTGFPKGVLYSHAAYLAVYAGLVIEGDLGRNDVSMVALPLFHNGGLNALLQPTLMMGGTAVIMAKGFDPDRILSAVGRHGVTLTMWVPTMLAMLINHPAVADFNLTTLKKIWYGSSPITPTVLESSRNIFQAKFYQWYGQTETGMNSILRPGDHDQRSQCTGREIFNAELRIVDQNGQDTPRGQVGEIISAQVPLGMIGYNNMAAATQKTIQQGWIHTGDLARVEGNGYFTVVDRLKDMIISGAENIYPKEVEDVISSHSAVREVAVIGIPDEIYGESVCAMVVAKPGSQLNEAAVVDYCATRLASYKKPKKVVFMSELPKNAAGKVTKNVLREPFRPDREIRIDSAEGDLNYS
ncbi:MAG: long-chain fatty acid--CoA ligase [bacterium]|nr:long-chain fatty acid--CoA ligase [bacterium]